MVGRPSSYSGEEKVRTEVVRIHDSYSSSTHTSEFYGFLDRGEVLTDYCVGLF